MAGPGLCSPGRRLRGPYTRHSGKQSGALYRQRMGFPASGAGLLPHIPRGRRRAALRPLEPIRRPGELVRYTAAPQLYSQMVAEDRRLQLAGYEIYRFGRELTEPGG